MKNQKSKFLITNLTVLFLFWVIISSFMLVSGASYSINSYQADVPAVNGIVDTNEEQGTGKPVKITLSRDPWDTYMKPDILDIKVGSSHSNDSYLYINTIVNYKKIISGNITYLFQREITDNYFDLKRISSTTNSCIDGYRQDMGTLWKIYKDVDIGGTQDSEGLFSITNKYIMFELRIPFNSGDSTGHDISIAEGETIMISFEFSFLYNLTDDETMYGNYYTHDCLLILQETTAAPVSMIGISLGLMLIIGVSVRKKRRKM